jgi:hypothetical protein
MWMWQKIHTLCSFEFIGIYLGEVWRSTSGKVCQFSSWLLVWVFAVSSWEWLIGDVQEHYFPWSMWPCNFSSLNSVSETWRVALPGLCLSRMNLWSRAVSLWQVTELGLGLGSAVWVWWATLSICSFICRMTIKYWVHRVVFRVMRWWSVLSQFQVSQTWQ